VCEKERDEEKGSRSKDKKEGGAEERERGREEEGHFYGRMGLTVLGDDRTPCAV
jgi:hypothetical protein